MSDNLLQIAPDKQYYFWDKQLQAIGILVVTRSDGETFDFRYLGKSYVNVPCSSARGKLFLHPEDVPRQ